MPEKDYTKQYETVYQIVEKWLYEKGSRLAKKHGNWITLYAPHNQVIIMDSWNGHIQQAHCTDTLVSNGFGLEGQRSVHTSLIPAKYRRMTYDDLDQAVDVYKTLLTIPS